MTWAKASGINRAGGGVFVGLKRMRISSLIRDDNLHEKLSHEPVSEINLYIILHIKVPYQNLIPKYRKPRTKKLMNYQ